MYKLITLKNFTTVAKLLFLLNAVINVLFASCILPAILQEITSYNFQINSIYHFFSLIVIILIRRVTMASHVTAKLHVYTLNARYTVHHYRSRFSCPHINTPCIYIVRTQTVGTFFSFWRASEILPRWLLLCETILEMTAI